MPGMKCSVWIVLTLLQTPAAHTADSLHGVAVHGRGHPADLRVDDAVALAAPGQAIIGLADDVMPRAENVTGHLRHSPAQGQMLFRQHVDLAHGRHSDSHGRQAAALRGRTILIVVIISAAGVALLATLTRFMYARQSGESLSQQLQECMSGPVFKTVVFGMLYIVSSAALINFNKYLITPGRFPFAASLTTLHAAFATVLSVILRLVRPSLFPSLQPSDSGGTVVDRKLVLLKIMPISIFFCGVLLLGNTAYLHCTVAFIQFMKEFNVVLVYLCSIIALLESPSVARGMVILGIVGATSMCIKGEMNFSLMGFVLTSLSSVLEALRVTLQALTLQGSSKLDPLSYVALIMPPLFVCLLVVQIVAGESHWDLISIAGLRDYASWWHLLLPNCCLAFGLNITIAMFVGNSGAIAYMLCGIVKDCCIVLVDVLVLGEHVSPLQVVGYAFQIVLISLFSAIKLFPDLFQNGVIAGMRELCAAWDQLQAEQYLVKSEAFNPIVTGPFFSDLLSSLAEPAINIITSS
eukprot:CAMPEP_0168403986 /NCGR_PEP_ID=MMETSP0228-20121227/24408_1 /TAXON_ID=133427 /ORGANISM="Protoceratium reticulatum, Strain CCCM 535 (=CCMP 1889)" /LENGTH=521 /DNA_ID=CAMNT_0008417599 /DNA_START=46 /DNA_END=1606 /DNA_ORIENTATION=-